MVEIFRQIGRGLNNVLPEGALVHPILYLNNQNSKCEMDFGLQFILHKRVFREVFVKMTQILDFHPWLAVRCSEVGHGKL